MYICVDKGKATPGSGSVRSGRIVSFKRDIKSLEVVVGSLKCMHQHCDNLENVLHNIVTLACNDESVMAKVGGLIPQELLAEARKDIPGHCGIPTG